jgi:spore coat polysaccharide biosynthesis protein SpsF (cytidylyltransferase family)
MTIAGRGPLRLVAIVQARLESTRLPRKVLAEIGGRSLLDRLMGSLLTVDAFDDVVLAVPESDAELRVVAAERSWTCHAGSELDVLRRFEDAARESGADAIARVSADCPLIDPRVVASVAHTYRSRPVDYFYVSGYPLGTGEVEFVSREALERVNREATEPTDREHVITYITRHPESFTIVIEQAPEDLRRPSYRVCVDESADLELVSQIVARLGDPAEGPRVEEIVELLDRSPRLRAINAHVQQRKPSA